VLDHADLGGEGPELICDCRDWASARVSPVISVLVLEAPCTTGALITWLSRKMATMEGAGQAAPLEQPLSL